MSGYTQQRQQNFPTNGNYQPYEEDADILFANDGHLAAAPRA